MRSTIPHRLDLSPHEARSEQFRLRRLMRCNGFRRRRVRRVAGCDVAVRGDRVTGAVLVFSFPELQLLEAAVATRRATMPYIPGLLSFRELPVLLDAFEQIEEPPDAVLCDAQGRAHPRRFGLACHLGVLLDLPTAGCAKSRLVGGHTEPGPARGSTVPLRVRGSTVGRVVRTRDQVKPLYVSAGHRMGLADAVWLTLQCGRGFRLPEPTRLADRRAGQVVRGERPI